MKLIWIKRKWNQFDKLNVEQSGNSSFFLRKKINRQKSFQKPDRKKSHSYRQYFFLQYKFLSKHKKNCENEPVMFTQKNVCLSPFDSEAMLKLNIKNSARTLIIRNCTKMYAWRTWWECCITKNPDDSWIAIDYSNLLFGMAVWSSVSSCEHLLLR